MNSPIVSIIVAHGEKREIGAKNDLLWHIPEDMKRFKALTTGHPVIMGRKTYESIPEKFRPLPNRVNIVITRDETYKQPGTIIAHSLDEALDKARENEREEIFIIGGGEIYRQALPFTNRLYVTEVQKSFPDADTFFPDYSDFQEEILRENHEDGSITYLFRVLEKY